MPNFTERLDACYFNMDNIPNDFIDPISLELMDNPVTLSDGHIYDASTARDLFEKKSPSPKTRETLNPSIMLPSHKMRSDIIAFVENQERLAAPLITRLRKIEADLASEKEKNATLKKEITELDDERKKLKRDNATLKNENQSLKTKIDESQPRGFFSFLPFFSSSKAPHQQGNKNTETELRSKKPRPLR